MAIDGTVSGQIALNDRRTVGLNAAANIPVNAAPSFTFADGTGALAGNILYQATRALTAGADNVDMNGVLTDSYGSSVAMLRVKALYIKNNSAAATMVFGAHATAAWATFLNATGTITLRPGAWIILAASDATGYAVTATTGDIIKVAGTGTDTFDIVILGANA